MLLATGLLGTVIFAALVLAVQERYQKAPVFTDEVDQSGGEISLNANPLVLSRVMGFDAGKGGEIPSGPTTNADEGVSPRVSPPKKSPNCEVMVSGTSPRFQAGLSDQRILV
jgi:hypothetical protein